MRIEIDASSLRRTRWYHYAIRFLFGGLITAAAGMIAREWGPIVGGLFLAFPAIFPASATLVEKEERQKKEKVGLHGAVRGRKAAGVDAAGAVLGCLGLILFALTVWRLLPHCRASWVLPAATVVWLLAAIVAWYIRKKL
jgi:Protein of unknown function (DUF3147)